jgi:hypothetical protein
MYFASSLVSSNAILELPCYVLCCVQRAMLYPLWCHQPVSCGSHLDGRFKIYPSTKPLTVLLPSEYHLHRLEHSWKWAIRNLSSEYDQGCDAGGHQAFVNFWKIMRFLCFLHIKYHIFSILKYGHILPAPASKYQMGRWPAPILAALYWKDVGFIYLAHVGVVTCWVCNSLVRPPCQQVDSTPWM